METKHNNTIFSFLVGGLSGAIAKTAVAPFERAKLLLSTVDPAYIEKYVKRDKKKIIKSNKIGKKM